MKEILDARGIDAGSLVGKFSSVSTDRPYRTTHQEPEPAPRTKCVLQDWVLELSMMQQTVLLTAVRGPDGIGKYHPCKYLLRWYRRCMLLSALDGRVIDNPVELNGGSFTGPSIEFDAAASVEHEWWAPRMDEVVSSYLRSLDELPHHFQMHFMHAAQIVGYRHSDPTIRGWWANVYLRLVNDLHLHPETQAEMDKRLGDNRDQWLARNDKATVE